MGFDRSDYDCLLDSEGHTRCELSSERSTVKRAASGCWNGTSTVGSFLSVVEPVVNFEPGTSVALKAGGCSVGAYREWNRPEEVVFLGDE